MAASRKRPALRRVEVTRSFEAFRIGDVVDLEITDTVQGWIRAGVMRLAEVVNDGQDAAGPGATGEDDLRGSGPDAAPEGSASSGAGEDEGSGGHGTPEVVGAD